MRVAEESSVSWQIPGDLRLALLALLATDPTRETTITYDEFLAWADEDHAGRMGRGKDRDDESGR